MRLPKIAQDCPNFFLLANILPTTSSSVGTPLSISVSAGTLIILRWALTLLPDERPRMAQIF